MGRLQSTNFIVQTPPYCTVGQVDPAAAVATAQLYEDAQEGVAEGDLIDTDAFRPK
jgi:hypothetical protein